MVGRNSLPHHASERWAPEPLGRIGKWLSGGTPRMSNPEFWDGGIPWVSPKDMKRSRLWNTVDHVTVKALGNGTRLAPAHSLLLVVRGMILAHTFPVARAEVPLAFNQDIKALVPRQDVDSDFLLWWLTANESLLLGITTESTHGTKRVPMDGLYALAIHLPELPEQRAIAAALSDVDALLGGLDRLIAKKRDLKQAAMQQLLTGQTRLPGFHGEWEVKPLADVGRCLRGVSYQGDSDLSTHDTAKTKRLLRANNIQNAVVVTDDVQFVNFERVSSSQILREQDILVCMANGSKALVGKAGVFAVRDGYEYTFGAFMSCFRTEGAVANPGFVSFLFHTGRYRNYINSLLAGSSINNLRPNTIASLEFSFPTIAEQSAIATVLSDMDTELAALEARRDKTRALKQAMMQELLTGRTRLV